MSFLLDLLILLIAGLTIFFAVKNGFIKTFLSTASTLIALIIVLLFSTPLTEALARSPLADAVRTNTEACLDQLIEDSGAEDSYSLASDRDGELYPILESVGIDSEKFSRWVGERESMAKDAFREALIDYIAEPVIRLLLRVLSVALLFFGSLLLLRIASFLLSGVIERIPFLREANHILGLVLGVLLALIRVFLFCAVMRVLLNTAGVAGVSALAGIDPEKTLLFRLFDGIHLLRFLF